MSFHLTAILKPTALFFLWEIYIAIRYTVLYQPFDQIMLNLNKETLIAYTKLQHTKGSLNGVI